MTGFSAVGEWAVAEFRCERGVVRLPDVLLRLDAEPPVVVGGASIAPPAAVLSLSAPAPGMDVGAEILPPAVAMTLSAAGVRVSGGGSLAATSAALSLTADAPIVVAGGSIGPDAAGIVLTAPAPQIVRLVNVRPRSAMMRLTAFPPKFSRAAVVRAWMVERVVTGLAVGEAAVGVGGRISERDVTPPLVLTAPAPRVTGGARVSPPAAILSLTSAPPTPVMRLRPATIIAIAS